MQRIEKHLILEGGRWFVQYIRRPSQAASEYSNLCIVGSTFTIVATWPRRLCSMYAHYTQLQSMPSIRLTTMGKTSV